MNNMLVDLRIESVGLVKPSIEYELDKSVFEKTGIEKVNIFDDEYTTSKAAICSAKDALKRIDMAASDLDQLIFQSEGMSDYLYMDSSKTIMLEIGGRECGNIYTYDFFRGNNGIIGTIYLINNQLTGNPEINYSMLCSSLLWTYHSKNRQLGDTYLGDGAGAVILSCRSGGSRVLGLSTLSFSQYNKITAFKIGGTVNDINVAGVKAGDFIYDILDYDHLASMREQIVTGSLKVISQALSESNLKMKDIDVIGILGFKKNYNAKILNEILEGQTVIDLLSKNGYLGSVGFFAVINEFLYNEKFSKGDILLLIMIGMDYRIEAMVVRK
ncbi:MAG TPA: hypothetical protein GXZ43_05445 [Clostridiaceae bacterium]|nr:hypothetical protein [Clostridiaceae bacterium]